MRDRQDFAAIEAHVRHSVIVRTIEAIDRVWCDAWRDSAVVARLRGMRRRFLSMTAPVRLRAVAVAVGSAAAGYLALLAAMPAQVTPAVPRATWLVVFAFAVLAALFSDRLAASWPSSSIRRQWAATIGRAVR